MVGLSEICGRNGMPQLLVFAFAFNLLSNLENDPMINTLWSKVECEVVPSGESCPRGSHYIKDQCIPYPQGDPNWSLSSHCADKDIVQGRTAGIMAALVFCGSCMALVANALSGPIADTYGRKSVLLLASLCLILLCFTMSVSCLLSWNDGFLALVFVANFIGYGRNAADVAATSLCADLCEGDAESGFAALMFMSNIPQVLAYLVGVPILSLNLENYAWMWCAFGSCSVIVLLFGAWILIESPKNFEISGCREICNGMRMALRDPSLGHIIVVDSIVWAGYSATTAQCTNYLTNYLDYSQAIGSLSGALIPLALCMGSAVTPGIVRVVELRRAFALGIILAAAGFTICGIGGIFPTHAAPLYWFGITVVGFGVGIFFPTRNALLKSYTKSGFQGTVFSASAAANTVLAQVQFLWADVFFQAGSTGWRAGLPFFAGAGTSLLALTWFAIWSALYRADRRYGYEVTINDEIDVGGVDPSDI